MENITLGQIASVVAFLGAFIGGVIVLFKYIKTCLKGVFKEEFTDIKKEISSLRKDFNNHTIEALKRDLVNLMCNAEQERITEEQKKLAHELYDVYVSAGGNSYVHDKWEKLKKEGKI